jgi:hypothetical protein
MARTSLAEPLPLVAFDVYPASRDLPSSDFPSGASIIDCIEPHIALLPQHKGDPTMQTRKTTRTTPHLGESVI